MEAGTPAKISPHAAAPDGEEDADCDDGKNQQNQGGSNGNHLSPGLPPLEKAKHQGIQRGNEHESQNQGERGNPQQGHRGKAFRVHGLK